MWNARVSFLIFINMFLIIDPKLYESRCKLVRGLLKAKVPIKGTFLGQWVCLIEKVSNRDTSAFMKTPSGKIFYGLYQIPGEWCKVGRPGGRCNVNCESLLDDDIRDDTACAVHIFDSHGFKYWKKWNTRCKNDNLITNEIYKCPDLKQRMTYSELGRHRRALVSKKFQSGRFNVTNPQFNV